MAKNILYIYMWNGCDLTDESVRLYVVRGLYPPRLTFRILSTRLAHPEHSGKGQSEVSAMHMREAPAAGRIEVSPTLPKCNYEYIRKPRL